MGSNHSLHSSYLFILMNLLKKKIFKSFIRVKHKAVESRLSILSVSILKLHIIQCLLFMPDSESMYSMSDEIGTDCSITFWIHCFVFFFSQLVFVISFWLSFYDKWISSIYSTVALMRQSEFSSKYKWKWNWHVFSIMTLKNNFHDFSQTFWRKK